MAQPDPTASTLLSVKAQLPELRANIANAKAHIQLLREVGENPAADAQAVQVRDLENKLNAWEAAIRLRGL